MRKKTIAFIDSILSKNDVHDEVEEQRLQQNQYVFDGLEDIVIFQYKSLCQNSVQKLLNETRLTYFDLIISHIPFSKEKYNEATAFYQKYPYESYLLKRDELILAQYQESLDLLKRIEIGTGGAMSICAYTGASSRDLSDAKLQEYCVIIYLGVKGTDMR